MSRTTPVTILDFLSRQTRSIGFRSLAKGCNSRLGVEKFHHLLWLLIIHGLVRYSSTDPRKTTLYQITEEGRKLLQEFREKGI
ncbi:hypothetical protein Syn6312_1144 [Synechococcus sp. PCC 6312]|nr:hypothetical protein Syn6312_1144 [Synechococcus sp. PCC 6312]